jgi:thymidylate synthase ThyX
MELAAEERALIAPYVTSVDAPVYALRGLPEEVVAVLFAYYSRSREPLRTNLLRLLQDQELDVAGPPLAAEDEESLRLARSKAREFHEKWVVGYGHASVAEHAVAHVAVEEVSILASKAIEDCRLAAYTEKSTRYVPFPRAYHHPDELAAGVAARVFRETAEGLFDLYEALLPQVTERVMERADRSAFKTEAGFRNSCRAQACDALRYLLPAATYTNLGLTANARTLEHMISKLLSGGLAEYRALGEALRGTVTRIIPTLLKYARPRDYWMETPPAMRAAAGALELPAGGMPETGSVRIVHAPADADARLAAAILYEFADRAYDTVLERVRAMDEGARRGVIEAYLAGRRTYGTPPHTYTDPPLRALEHVAFTVEIVVDYGAYRDIQRHRMATQTSPRLTCREGCETPDLLRECGFADDTRRAMETAATAWERLEREHPEAAQYVVPLAYRKRVLFTWNLREIHHFIALRSARQGHPSYRRVAQELYRELERSHPFLARFIQADLNDYALARPG